MIESFHKKTAQDVGTHKFSLSADIKLGDRITMEENWSNTQ